MTKANTVFTMTEAERDPLAWARKQLLGAGYATVKEQNEILTLIGCLLLATSPELRERIQHKGGT